MGLFSSEAMAVMASCKVALSRFGVHVEAKSRTWSVMPGGSRGSISSITVAQAKTLVRSGLISCNSPPPLACITRT